MKHSENQTARFVASLLVCTVTHLAFAFVVWLIVSIRKKPVDYPTYVIAAFLLPSITAGWLLGRTAGISKPMFVVPASAAIVWSAFALTFFREWNVASDAVLAVVCSFIACVASGMHLNRGRAATSESACYDHK